MEWYGQQLNINGFRLLIYKALKNYYLGSSAPEILLSIIEVVGKGFEAGDLGPNTIVGSAAFNLFMIIAICVYAVPSTEIRRQKHLDVFFVTATWCVKF